jgi:hypothetical protein
MNAPMNTSMNVPVIRPQLPVQANLNPNNKMVQQVETSTFPSYSIGPLVCNDVHLRSGRVIHPENSPIITEQLEDKPLPPETEQHHEGNENPTHVVTSGVTTTITTRGCY